ncbi:hypothetical protein BSL78_06993 [Apostichopus japonicus]|uniref:Ig-like domain-containing protein n=1 Tax=Stichopus japonicus TaxID=307972 RepID=A0A2G8L747_STIJA|nr:hypothetical protein BSL78_06993 [Apostichopus japonicus]
MEYLYKLFVISILFVQLDQVLCESQEVYFEIKDGNFNEVIFIGEKDITLICHVSKTLHADVTITKVGEGSVATNGGIGNCLEYNIQQVAEQNGGNYSCTSRYEDKNTGRMVEMSRMLSVNVRDNHFASCLRNGTGLHQAYSEDDVLLLSCYCYVSIECNWIKTVVGSKVGESIPSIDFLQHKSKVIRRIVVGPLTSMDLGTRYDRSFGSSIDKRCSFGPADESINDYISLPSQKSDLSEGCPIMVTPITSETKPGEITSTSDTNVVTSSTMDSKDTAEGTMRGQEIDEEPVDFLIYIIVGVSTVVVLCIVLLCFLIAIVRTKKGTTKQDQQADEKHEEDRTDSQQEEYSSKTPTYAVPVKKKVSAEVIQYAASTATVKMNDEDDEVNEFRTVDVTEYNIPVAFRTDEFGENFQQREEN